MGKLGKVILAIGGVAVVGVCGYGVGAHNHNNQVKHQGVKSEVKSELSSKASSKSLKVSSSQSLRSSSSLNNNGQLYDPSTGTFAGYHNIHELWNAGYTVTSYLIKKCGYTADQAHEYIRNHYNEIRPFLGSSEIQTYNLENNSNDNQNNNQNGPSMHQGADGNWEDQYGHVYEHFTPEQEASIEAQANDNDD